MCVIQIWKYVFHFRKCTWLKLLACTCVYGEKLYTCMCMLTYTFFGIQYHSSLPMYTVIPNSHYDIQSTLWKAVLPDTWFGLVTWKMNADFLRAKFNNYKQTNLSYKLLLLFFFFKYLLFVACLPQKCWPWHKILNHV